MVAWWGKVLAVSAHFTSSARPNTRGSYANNWNISRLEDEMTKTGAISVHHQRLGCVEIWTA